MVTSFIGKYLKFIVFSLIDNFVCLSSKEKIFNVLKMGKVLLSVKPKYTSRILSLVLLNSI